MDPNNPYVQYIFFSAAMALYNSFMYVVREGTNEETADFTKHVRNDLNMYFMPKDSTEH
jgi:hypothetical protein